MIILSISQALHMARSYAEEYDVPWVGATSSRDSRCCRLFPLGEHQFVQGLLADSAIDSPLTGTGASAAAA